MRQTMKSYCYLLSLLFAFLLGINQSQAQNRFTEAADQAYTNLQYSIAATNYKKAYTKAKLVAEKERILFRLAECYRFINDTHNAEITYGSLVREGYGRQNTMVLLFYAEALRANEKYEDAKDIFEQFAKAEPKDSRGQNGIISCDQTKKWTQAPGKYEVINEKKLN